MIEVHVWLEEIWDIYINVMNTGEYMYSFLYIKKKLKHDAINASYQIQLFKKCPIMDFGLMSLHRTPLFTIF